jgi:hypothetical protein
MDGVKERVVAQLVINGLLKVLEIIIIAEILSKKKLLYGVGQLMEVPLKIVHHKRRVIHTGGKQTHVEYLSLYTIPLLFHQQFLLRLT